MRGRVPVIEYDARRHLALLLVQVPSKFEQQFWLGGAADIYCTGFFTYLFEHVIAL